MRNGLLFGASAAALAFAAAGSPAVSAAGQINHVLLVSIDGMHALDFANCSGGSGGAITCPTLAALAKTGLVYTQASTSKPSDLFPGLTALATGGSPKSTGAFYDVSYDRALSPPAKTTPYGIPGGPNLCPKVVGTQVGFDEEIDIDYRRLDAGGGINTAYLPRDPKNGCVPVYPHNFIRVNTMFEVVHDAGGYTAWSDKHQSYELTKGMSGTGVDDFYAPEINSIPVPLPQVTSMSCSPLPDQTASHPQQRLDGQLPEHPVLRQPQGSGDHPRDRWFRPYRHGAHPRSERVRHELPGGERRPEARRSIDLDHRRLYGCDRHAEQRARG